MSRLNVRRALGIAGATVGALTIGGCGGGHRPATAAFGAPVELVRQARPIGAGARFAPPVGQTDAGGCDRRLGPRFGVHLELFAANRVVIVAAGIGTRGPRTWSAGRISRARCYGEVVTLDPTGVVLARRRAHPRLSDVFDAWGQPLLRRRLGPFTGPDGAAVRAYVNGRRRWGPPGAIALTAHDEIVLEIGAYVPPHAHFTFSPGT